MKDVSEMPFVVELSTQYIGMACERRKWEDVICPRTNGNISEVKFLLKRGGGRCQQFQTYEYQVLLHKEEGDVICPRTISKSGSQKKGEDVICPKTIDNN